MANSERHAPLKTIFVFLDRGEAVRLVEALTAQLKGESLDKPMDYAAISLAGYLHGYIHLSLDRKA